MSAERRALERARTHVKACSAPHYNGDLGVEDIETLIALAESGESDIVAGALFDFCGFLTTRPTVVTLSSAHEPHDILEALGEWAEARGLDIDSPRVMDWQAAAPEPSKRGELIAHMRHAFRAIERATTCDSDDPYALLHDCRILAEAGLDPEAHDFDWDEDESV